MRWYADFCWNPRCRDWLPPTHTYVLCPSCRLAGSWGVGVAFVVGALLKLIGLL